MTLWAKLKAALSMGQRPSGKKGFTRQDGQGVYVYIQCQRCGEQIALRLRKTDEMVRSQGQKDYAFFVQKTVMGNQCFNRMDARIEFDQRHEVVNSTIHGGILIPAADYKEESKKPSR